MDPPTPPPTTTTDSHSHPLPPLPNTKLRLMCSYGGRIIPRPHDKSLCYVAGETRIVAIDRRTTAASLFSLSTHISTTLYNNRPFTLKYQLPTEDLDSLISVATDEDLQNMIEEHDRIVSSPTPSRIRLFLFPSKPESVGTVLIDQKTESWFCDALKNTMIIQRGESADSGNGLLDSNVEGRVESFEFGSVPESMVLETSSSFGSTNSSNSMSNLPPIGVHGEDGGVTLQDKKVKVVSTGSIESDNSVASAVSHPKTGINQDQVVHVTSSDTKVSSNTVESESIVFDPSSVIRMQRTTQVSGYQLSNLSEQNQQLQEVQYIHPGSHYVQQYPYPMYHPSLHQQQHSLYQPSQPYPIYFVPVRPTESYIMPGPGPHNLNDTATVALNCPPLRPHTAMITPQIHYSEVTTAPPIPELITEAYTVVPALAPLDSAPSNQNQQQFMAPPEMYPYQSVATASMATADYDDVFGDDLAYAQIYKSQPSAPALPPQYQTMTKAASVVLSEASGQLNRNNIKQQLGTTQP